MERFGLDLTQAFAALVRTSQTTDTKLYMVAERIVETLQTPAVLVAT